MGFIVRDLMVQDLPREAKKPGCISPPKTCAHPCSNSHTPPNCPDEWTVKPCPNQVYTCAGATKKQSADVGSRELQGLQSALRKMLARPTPAPSRSSRSAR